MNQAYNRNLVKRRGFTLIEMLIAMAVTLLLMAALGKSFAYVGESIRDSRTQVGLANDLRDITNRLSSDLATSTSGLKISTSEYEPSGYFMFYEGPLTDATSSLFLAQEYPNVSTPASRYGDFDDYLAFTAVASGDNWFTGKVPRFILDQKAAELSGQAYTPGTNALDPIVIKSKFAEIIYFASPEYVPESMDAPETFPLRMVDVDKNGLPGRVKLHRRVLLIRPDLNFEPVGGLKHITPRLIDGRNYLRPDNWPNGSGDTYASPNAWQIGMAAVHQQCDLSLRRVLINGVPQPLVAANSLEDLSIPHNRFAHVRVPGGLVGLGGEFTSMPILALGDLAPVFSATHPSGTQLAPPSIAGMPVVTPPHWGGFIRPEFVLGYNRVHPSDPRGPWGISRLGEDVIATDLIAFDIKLFDRTSPVITTAPTPGNGTRQVVTPSEPGFREVLRQAVAVGNVEFTSGGYVDLMYPVLAGGSLRGWQPRYFDNLPTTPLDGFFPGTAAPFQSQFGGVRQTAGPTNTYFWSLYRSGKVLVAGNQIQIFQPTWDTYTSHYEKDGLEQSHSGVAGSEGSRWRVQGVANPDRVNDGLSHDLDNNVDASPPFLESPESIQITVRLENVPNRAIKQLSIIYRDSK